MKRFVYFVAFCFLPVLFVFAQYDDPVLMKINGKEITRSEFEYLYNKNNASERTDDKSLHEYLKLFVNYKLKVAEAESLGLDKTSAFQTELDGYKQDLSKEYFAESLKADLSHEQPYGSKIDIDPGKQVLIKQVFKYLPQNCSKCQQHRTESFMDSLSFIIENDPLCDFDKLIENHSDDKNELWLHKLEVPEEVEQVIFSMGKNQISKPFYSSAGLHIVKLLDVRENDLDSGGQIMTRAYSSGKKRNNYDPEIVLQKFGSEYQYVPDRDAMNDLCRNGYTDKVLFTLMNTPYTYTDFKRFAESNHGDTSKLLEDFITKSILDCRDYDAEQENRELTYLMQEYRDGMLLFEISNREVWEKATSDKAGLKAYFNVNKKNYNWDKPRYEGVVIHCSDKKTGKSAKKLTKNVPLGDWEDILMKYFNSDGVERVKVEKGVYAEGDNKYVDKIVFKKGNFTPLSTHPHTIVVGKKIKGPENHEEVIQQLTADYQDFLETAWLKRLHAKSKVEINQEVLKTVNNHSSD